MKIKDYILKTVNKPTENVLSSQTLYEVLMTSMTMYETYHDDKYKKTSIKIAQIIIDTQLSDGGFDIGYNFSFGKNMSKKNNKESTTPEILSIFALIKFYEVFGEDFVIQPINYGIKWIKKYSYKLNEKYWVIPYAPISYKEIHITNAISFTVATLVKYMTVFQDFSVKDICDGMILYMKDELITQEDAGYWNYFEKELMSDSYHIKIDNYHIAQQLYYHQYIATVYDNKDNLFIVNHVSKYLIDKLKESLIVPYIEINDKKTEDIHTWGYCSLLSCSLSWDDKQLSKDIKNFIVDKMWAKDHFYPVIKGDGSVVIDDYYPRSDAWILHSLSEWIKHNEDAQVKEIVVQGIEKLERCQFSGRENHVLTIRKIFFNKAVLFLKSILKRK